MQGAIEAAEYLWRVHRFEGMNDSGLWRASLNGKTSVAATQADYAYLAQGFLALYDVTEDKLWLERSEQIYKDMNRLFWDKEQGSFFMSIADQEVPLFDRPRDTSISAFKILASFWPPARHTETQPPHPAIRIF